MAFLDPRASLALLIIYMAADSLCLRTKEGMCKTCVCEQLNVGSNRSLKIDCSRLAKNDVDDLMGDGKDGNMGVWSLPYEAYEDFGVVRIILDSNVIHHLKPLPALRREPKNATISAVASTASSRAVTKHLTDVTAANVSPTVPSPESPGSPPLLEVSFQGNHMNRIDPGAFTSLTKSIWSIDLSKNDLTYDALTASVFRGEFSDQRYEPLVCLKELNLARNFLHSLDAKLFEHISGTLEDLNLQGNPLGSTLDTVTEHALSTLQKLKTLNLADVGITSYPEGLAHALISLENLRLDGNKLVVVPASLSAASSSLRYINLNRNPMQKLNASSFLEDANQGSSWSKLEILEVNALPELTHVMRGSFENLPSLRKLQCAFNQKLFHFDEEAFRRMKDDETEDERWMGFQLKELQLQGNGLQWLSPNVVPWNELDYADLQGNPWFCDCSLRPLANAIRVFIRTRTPNMSTGLLCAVPFPLKGVNFLTTYPDDDEVGHDGSSLEEWSTKPGDDPHRLWSDCDNKSSRTTFSSMGALASALAAVGVTLVLSLVIVAVLIYVVRKSIRAERLNLPGQVRYVRAPPTKDEEDEQVIMDMRWATASRDKFPTTNPVVLDSRTLGTEYRWPRS